MGNMPDPEFSKWTRKTSRSLHKSLDGVHRFEHWYRDNQVHFISARCRDRSPAFASEQAKAVFWTQFERYTREFEFTPWVTSLIDNHYHTIGYNKWGRNLGDMMRRLHGSVAKLVNVVLEMRLLPFWRSEEGHDYFDGCLRDEIQGRRTYRYVLIQSERHGIVGDYSLYPHTRVNIELERAIERASELRAFLYGVPYKRYQDRKDPPV